MPKSERVIYEGECFTVEWGLTPDGQCQARDHYFGMSVDDQAKASALFARMGDQGKIYDKTKFRKETGKLYVFKPQPHRFFCFFVKGKRILITTAFSKQGDKMPQREIDRAETTRLRCLERLSEEEAAHGKE